MCENCSRREFLGSSALGGLLLTSATALSQQQTTPAAPAARAEKVKICVMFTGRPCPPDRAWGLCEQEITAITRQLSDLEKKLGNVVFEIGRVAKPAEAAALLAKSGDDAPVLAINVSINGLLPVSEPILASGRPLAVFSAPASGHDWMYPFRWRDEGMPVTMFTSSDYAELERAARLLRTVPLMKQTKVLVFEPMRGTENARSPEKIKERLGISLLGVPQERFDDLLKAVSEDEAHDEAQRWLSEAKRNIEPTNQDVLKAARVSLALDALIEQEQAQALAVGTCMGWLSRGFPCLGFTRLRDRGIPASCEGDMDSLLTMILFGYMFNLPGFQGNATFDTSKNAVWTAHCVGPLRMDGPQGPSAPYLLRSHSEIGGGVVPEIQYRLGQKITRTKLVNLDTLLMSTGTIREVPDKSVRACRTQIVTEVGDAAQMVRNWGGGVLNGDMMTLLHRVVFYGDHVDSGRHMADLLQMKVVMEG